MKRPWGKKETNVPRRRQSNGDVVAQNEPQSRPSANTIFRRNRTLVGSLSASVSSANELGGDLRSPRAHVHHLTAHRRRLSSILLVVIVGSGLLVWLLYEFTAGITISPTASGLVINEQRYKQAINDYFAGRPIERLRFMLNEAQLSDYLINNTAEVAAVHNGGSSGLASSQFDLTFRRPVAGWLIKSQQYYVDKDGVSFQLNYFERPTVKIADQSGVPQSTGNAVASSQFLRFVGRAVELARGSGLIVEQAVIPVGTTRQIEMRTTGHNYPVKLSLDRPVGEQVEDMQRSIAYMDAHHLNPAYIDVRVSGKAFYR
jgi:hypothetical protein